MKTAETIIAHPENTEELTALKAVLKALKIKFEIAKKEKPYNKAFINMVMEADDEIKSGKGHNITSDEFDDLWK